MDESERFPGNSPQESYIYRVELRLYLPHVRAPDSPSHVACWYQQHRPRVHWYSWRPSRFFPKNTPTQPRPLAPQHLSAATRDIQIVHASLRILHKRKQERGEPHRPHAVRHDLVAAGESRCLPRYVLIFHLELGPATVARCLEDLAHLPKQDGVRAAGEKQVLCREIAFRDRLEVE